MTTTRKFIIWQAQDDEPWKLTDLPYRKRAKTARAAVVNLVREFARAHVYDDSPEQDEYFVVEQHEADRFLDSWACDDEREWQRAWAEWRLRLFARPDIVRIKVSVTEVVQLTVLEEVGHQFPPVVVAEKAEELPVVKQPAEQA